MDPLSDFTISKDGIRYPDRDTIASDPLRMLKA